MQASVCGPVPMRDDAQKELKPEVRQLPHAMSVFLKHALPEFTVEKCADAVILTLAEFLPIADLLGFLWESARHSTHRTRLTLENGQVMRARESAPPAEIVQREAASESQDDLKLVLHRSLKTVPIQSDERRTLESRGCRAAIEVHFAYYTRPILRIVVGLMNPKSLPANDGQDFLLAFCRCCHVSLNGAYLAELDEREGRREAPELQDRFNLTLQWFHALVRHLNIAVTGLQKGNNAAVEDALDRASIVAGICLAENLALMRKFQP
jgi:hypothetical protein